MAAIKIIEKQTGKEFGNPSNPLLFSVRSGAAISMPGMLDTGTSCPSLPPSLLPTFPPCIILSLFPGRPREPRPSYGSTNLSIF